MLSPANAALVESWTLSLHAKSRGTVKHYVDEVTRFADWLTANGRPAGAPGDLLAVKRNDCEAWIGALRDEGRAQATIRARWIAARSFYGWLLEEEELERSPLERVVVAKGSPPPVPTLSTEEIAALLKACSGAHFLDKRDAAMIRLMVGTGLRVAEVTDLAVADLDLAHRIAHVRHGKGDKARLVRLDPATAAAIDRYKRARARHALASSPWLWLSSRGKITTKGVSYLLNRRATAAGIGHVNPHKLRHTFADRWLSAGGSEGDLQRLGGWESADIMRRYGSHRASDRALNAYDEINPMGDL
jgi:site-specific recombinase XerD